MQRRASERGFTLVELMAVVTMVAVLAMIAVYGVRKYVLASKASEAYVMINAIKSAQEAYKDETGTYLNVSQGDYTRLYPRDPDQNRTHWIYDSGPDYVRWQALGVDSQTAVQFGYAVVAGNTGAPTPVPGLTEPIDYPPDRHEPWYVVLAVGDRDGDGIFARIVSLSESTDIHVEREDE